MPAPISLTGKIAVELTESGDQVQFNIEALDPDTAVPYVIGIPIQPEAAMMLGGVMIGKGGTAFAKQTASPLVSARGLHVVPPNGKG